MSKKDENMEWETEAQFLASLPKTTPYRVPDKYFEELTTQINQSVFIAELSLNEASGFAVPNHYFDELSNQIESKVLLDQLKDKGIDDGFKVPDEYFNQLQASILAKTSADVTKTKVFRLWQTDLIKYAAAACVILVAAVLFHLNQLSAVKVTRTAELVNEQMLYDIDESVIIEHLEESKTANATQASNKELENYILDNYSSSDLSNNL